MVTTRLVVSADTEFLWQMVYWAAHVDEDEGVTLDDMRRDPDLVGHVAEWGRRGDLGAVAELDGVPVGAAWLRLFVRGVSDYSAFVDDETPELVAAVAPEHLGRGIGSVVLTSLFRHADRVYDQTVLSVRTGNPAARLYERFGFRELDRHVNRVGTESARMVRRAADRG